MASRPSRSLAACGKSPGQIDLADLDQLIEVSGRAVTVDDALQDALEPGATLAARRALAARSRGRRSARACSAATDVGGVVHHHDRAGAEHRAGRADELGSRTAGRVGREGTTAPSRHRARTPSARCRRGCHRRTRRRTSRSRNVVVPLTISNTPGRLTWPRHGDHARARRGGRADRGVRLDAVAHQPRQVGQRLDVVDDGRLAVQADGRREVRRLQPRHAAVALEALDQRRLFADDVRAGTPVQDDVDTEVGAEDVLADVAGRVRLVERRRRRALGRAPSRRGRTGSTATDRRRSRR